MMDYVSGYISNSGLKLNFNTFGVNCYSNTFGDDCYSNTFGDQFRYNTFGYHCNSNTFGDNCSSNTFGNWCQSNTFGDNCSSNTLNYGCGDNTFGYNCVSNTFGNGCHYNTFGNGCQSNTFGNGCWYNKFYTDESRTTKKDYIRYIVLENRCFKNNFYSTLATNSTSYLQRIRIKGLEHTEPTPVQITLSETNTEYEWVVCYTSDGELRQYCPDDRLADNYTSKLEDTDVSTWVDSTAYAGYDYQAQINIDGLTENDIVSVIFSGADAISGNYYPTIQIYDGYILVFSKVNATITIPTIEITKINL